jgi:hypothetical protein
MSFVPKETVLLLLAILETKVRHWLVYLAKSYLGRPKDCDLSSLVGNASRAIGPKRRTSRHRSFMYALASPVAYHG